MKKFFLILALLSPVAFVSCATTPSARVVQVQTLKGIGVTAKTALDAATDLLKRHEITLGQWAKVADLYDTRFQPVYRVAVLAAQSDLSSAASPELISLGLELANLVQQLTTH